MKLVIKNMVCRHCVMAVRNLLSSHGIGIKDVQIGFAEIDDIDNPTLENITSGLRNLGFDTIDDSDSALVVRVKSCLVKLLRNDDVSNVRFSEVLSNELNMDYTQLSRIFTIKEGRTIEKFYIALKIERVKELLEYNELSIKEIAYRMGYSSTAHLSRQFKQVSGLTPTQYKEMSGNVRQSLEKV